MAGIYNEGIVRSAGTPDPLVPQPLAATIIQEAPKASAALTLMNKTTLSSKTQRMPVLDVLPMAYWVGGDTGLKQTSQMAWKNVIMVVEELACIVPIPIAYLDDADVPLWAQVQPRITEAVGALIDAAVLWGINKPATWGESVYVGAGLSGHVVVEGTGVDLGQDVSDLGQMMATTGYSVNGFAAMPGMNWKMVGMRSAQGIPIYQPDMTGKPGGTLYGYNMAEVSNGSWQLPTTTTGATLLAGDFTKAIIGIRQDISFKMFTEGVVSDDTGKVILNLMQQDAVAMRMVMRLAYATVNPVTVMNPGRAMTSRWPFGAILGKGATPPTQGPINIIGTYPGGTLLESSTAGTDTAAIEESMVGSPWEQGAREAMEEAMDREGDYGDDEGDDEGGTRRATRTARGRSSRASAERTARSADHTARSAEQTVRSTERTEHTPRSTDKEE
jgi:HK97 family phage major capsid protein